jgi:antibiotic biosynthesis monooxygenase (ABM) superfamily enzyme
MKSKITTSVRLSGSGHELKKNNFKNVSKTKMKLMASLKIWLAIYPSITLFLFLFGKAMTALPLYQRTFVLTVALVPWIVFIGVPFVDFIMRQFNTKENK